MLLLLPDVTYVTLTDSSVSNITTFALAPMLPWTTLHKFFRYNGSLTIPGCDESVTWTLFNDFVQISHEQVTKRGLLIQYD